MPSEFYLLTALIVAALALAVWLINRKINQLSQKSETDENLLKIIENLQSVPEGLHKDIQSQSRMLQEVLGTTNKNISTSLQSSTRAMNERLDHAAKYISQVAKEVGQMSELGQSMRDLQIFLQSPKLRGNIGEQVLKDLISQVFPKGSFFLQYTFKSGEKVDAAIKTSAGILPIDSKFPMENFRRISTAETKSEREKARRQFRKDVKKHIQDIAKKYVLTEEGTLDFAFMYLPSELVFHEVANDIDVLDFARKNRIYPVSPNTLYVHLQTVLLSFEGQKIETRSRQVFRLLRAIQKDYEKTEGTLQVLGRHINNAYNQFSNALQSFSLLGQKLSQTEALSEREPAKQKELET